MNRPIFVWIFMILFLMQTACATSPSVGLASLGDGQKSVGTIGIVSARFAPKVKFQKPERVKGADGAAGRGAGRALGATWKACGKGMLTTAWTIIGPFAILYGCIGVTPLMGIGGAVYGNLTSRTAKANRAAKKARRSEVKALRPVIEPAVAAMANEQPLHARLLQQVPARTDGTAVSITETGRLRYEDLAADGVDTVLEVTAPRLDVSPENAFILTAKVRLIRVADREELYANTHTFRIPSPSVSEWTANDGDALRAALVNGYQGLADKIAEDLFATAAAPSTAGIGGS